MSENRSTDLSTRQAAEYLNISKGLLEKWRCRGGGPKYIKYGPHGLVRYRIEDLDDFRAKSRKEG